MGTLQNTQRSHNGTICTSNGWSGIRSAEVVEGLERWRRGPLGWGQGVAVPVEARRDGGRRKAPPVNLEGAERRRGSSQGRDRGWMGGWG